MGKEASLQELADILGAQLEATSDVTITGLATLTGAQSFDISFLSSKTSEPDLLTTQAGAVVLKKEFADAFAGNKLIVDDPYLAYAKLSKFFDPRLPRNRSIHPTAVIAESAQISTSASIGAHCFIGENVNIGDNTEVYPGVVIAENSSIGENCLIYQNVSIYSNVRIGDSVIIHCGTVLGSDGFGFAPTKEGWVKIHQIGGVRIGNRVEIGANTAIDRGALNDTVIHDGVIIDNQVHIAHNVEVGEGTAIAGCVGIAGSTKIGKSCTFGGGVLINGHIELGDNTHCHGGTIITKSTPEGGGFASATPQMDVKKWRKSMVRFGQLDDMAVRMKKLERSLSDSTEK